MVKTPRLIEALMHRNATDLRVVAATRGIAIVQDAAKGDLVAALSVELPRAEPLREALAGLDSQERRAWNALIEAGGALNSRSFASYFGFVPGSAVRSYRPSIPMLPRPRKLWHPSEALWYRGLIASDDGAYEQVYIPAELLVAAGEPLPIAEPALAPADGPADPLPGHELLGDVLAALILMKRERFKLVRGGELARRNLLSLNAVLSSPHDWGEEIPNEYSAPYIGFLRMLLRGTGLATTREGRLRPSETAARWLAGPRHTQMRQIYTWYMAAEDTYAEEMLPHNYGLGRERSVEARKAIADTLRRCPVGQWISTTSLLQRLQHEQPQMLRTWDNKRYGYALWDDQGHMLPVASSWAAAEGLLTRAVLTGAFHWMGMVDADKAGDTFQLTPLGAYLLGARPSWEDEPETRAIIVQPNFEILAPAEASASHVLRLGDFSDLIKRDRIATYTVTQESLRRALETGDTADKIISFLAEASGRAVPQNMAYTLKTWAGRYGELEIRNLTVITATREDLLGEVRANSKVKAKVLEALGPKAVAVSDEDLAGLVRRLRKAGYSPKVDASTEPATPSMARVEVAESDLACLIAAARTVEQIAGAQVIPPGLTGRLQRQLSLSRRSAISEQVERMAQAIPASRPGSQAGRHGGAPLHSDPIVATLLSALHTDEQVDIVYLDSNSGETIEERVTPLRIESFRGMHHLVADVVGSEIEGQFDVESIKSARIVTSGHAPR